MKVVYPTCCGVDVHKSFLVATIIKTTSGIEPSYQKKRFSTFNNSILEFKNGCWTIPVVMSAWNLPVSIWFLCLTFWRTK